jgi:hypothetical protein
MTEKNKLSEEIKKQISKSLTGMKYKTGIKKYIMGKSTELLLCKLLDYLDNKVSTQYNNDYEINTPLFNRTYWDLNEIHSLFSHYNIKKINKVIEYIKCKIDFDVNRVGCNFL